MPNLIEQFEKLRPGELGDSLTVEMNSD